ncbi:MAG: hypothetical protein ACJAZ2_000898 [Glaciecola sp.]|jgi:hypothetical protein
MSKWFFSFVIVLILSGGCSKKNDNVAQRQELIGKAQGGYSDVVVVLDKKLWEKGLKSDVSFVFSEEIKGLYSVEHNFDVMHVTPKSFSSLFKKQRLIVEFEVSSLISRNNISYKEDKFAKGQLYIKVSAKDFEDASFLFLTSTEALRIKINDHRLRGIQEKIKPLSDLKSTEIFEQFVDARFVLTNYYDAIIKKEGFVYFGKRAKAPCQSGQQSVCSYQTGLFVSKMDYVSKEVFDEEAFVILRDSITKKYIVGPEKPEPTYMEFERLVPIHSRVLMVDGHYCVEYKGWWSMVNATMGGPFISYLLVDEKTSSLYLIDGFVFAPNFRKRDFLMELESMIKTLKI